MTDLKTLIDRMDQIVQENSQWGSPEDILRDVSQTLERDVEWPLTEIMDPATVKKLIAPLMNAIQQQLQQSTQPMAEALHDNNVVYKLDANDPMNASEILVLGGAGRYEFATLRSKAQKEAAQLAQDLSSGSPQAFRNAAHHIKQLENTLNTIVQAYDQLNRLRSAGGRRSRGIQQTEE
jgi:hypothetical protein